MIINLSDPEILKTYELVLKGESKDWLILAYSKVCAILLTFFTSNLAFCYIQKARDALRLAESGPGGPDALRSHMVAYSGDVAFALVQASGANSLVLLCYIPPTVGGVKRGK